MKRSRKRCPRCKRNLLLKCFGKHKGTKTGLHYWCKRCAAKKQAARRKKYPDYNIVYGWLIQGILPKHIYLAMRLRRRKNRHCDLCGVPESKFKYKLHVDHDHNNGKPRGLLCTICNSCISWYEKHQEVIERYLD